MGKRALTLSSQMPERRIGTDCNLLAVGDLHWPKSSATLIMLGITTLLIAHIQLASGFAIAGPVHPPRCKATMSAGGKGFGGGEATRDPEPTVIDPNDPKGKQQAIHKAESFASYLAKRGGGGGAGPSTSSTATSMSAQYGLNTRFAQKHVVSRDLKTLEALLDVKDVHFLERKGQIVATLGPASSNLEMIQKLVAAGVDVFRLNASHRRPGQFEELIPWIRQTAAELGRDVRILGDIQGPKFRCSLTVDDVPVPLTRGEVVEFGLAADDTDLTRPGRITLMPTTEQTALVHGVTPGMQLLLDDGFMEVTVKERLSPSAVTVEVVVGGKLKSRKGINVPELQIDCSALTVKDREDASYLLSMGVDYIALSFAQKAADVQELIDVMDAEGIPHDRRPLIIPKIEKPSALRNIDEILALSGGLMVARGDLGVELGLHRVPFAQKFLVRKANDAGKFCITATQMMESMITNAVPTRAEVSDVANAVFDGTDAVMLSGESAMGEDPIRVVQWMGRIIAEAEAHADDVAPSF